MGLVGVWIGRIDESALVYTIVGIVFYRAKEEVFWIDAWRVVTLMADENALWDWTVG